MDDEAFESKVIYQFIFLCFIGVPPNTPFCFSCQSQHLSLANGVEFYSVHTKKETKKKKHGKANEGGEDKINCVGIATGRMKQRTWDRK